MDEGLSPPLTGVYAALPSCVTESDVPQKYKEHFFSHEQNADAPMLKAVSMEFVDSTFDVTPSSGPRTDAQEAFTSPTGSPHGLPP